MGEDELFSAEIGKASSAEETTVIEISGEKKQGCQEEPQSATKVADISPKANSTGGGGALHGPEGQKSLGALEPKRVIEAALFISSKPLSTEELGKFIGVAAPGFVEGIVKGLAADYEKGGSSIKIVFEPGGWIMRLKGEYASKVATLAQEGEISRGAIRILGYISQNEGIEQSKVADRLGSTVYDYVRELVEKGFLDKQKKGRTSVLRTTQKFRDYFGS